MREICQQVEAEVLSKSRNKIHQACGPPYTGALYASASVAVDASASRCAAMQRQRRTRKPAGSNQPGFLLGIRTLALARVIHSLFILYFMVIYFEIG